MNRDETARRLVAEAERDYRRWRAAHPDSTTLEQLAEIYRRGNVLLREGQAAR